MSQDASEKRKALVVCGPTASGKTRLADHLADQLSEIRDGTRGGSGQTPTLVIDSMQVYKEIPNITNQGRGRAAELVGITSVSEDWNMALHREAAEKVLESTEGPFVLEAGTGMYLNALIMDIDVYPKASPQVREMAITEAKNSGSVNPRRDTRARELRISGHTRSGSIWDAPLRYDLYFLYIRLDAAALDKAIRLRTEKITAEGLEEASRLVENERRGVRPNPSVGSSIGVRELTGVVLGDITVEDAETRISSRTRKLARRQVRWFDKLATVLEGRVKTTVVDSPNGLTRQDELDMLDIIGS